MWQIVWSICFPFGELNIQRWNTKLCSAFKNPEKQDKSHCPIYTLLWGFLFFLNWLFGFQCSCPLTLPPSGSLSSPPLDRTAVLVGYHAWSIPCYHREINYLDQAAGERGNNERMLLLPRRWPRSLNMNLSLAEEIYGARCGPLSSRSLYSISSKSGYECQLNG